MYDSADASCKPYLIAGPTPSPPPHLSKRSRRVPPERYSRQMKLFIVACSGGDGVVGSKPVRGRHVLMTDVCGEVGIKQGRCTS